MFGPRGVMHSWATDTDDPTEEPRWGRVGKQRITDTGPLTKKRMETCDDDFVASAKAFMKNADDAGKPFFIWLNTTQLCISRPIPSLRAWDRRGAGSRPITTR
jgi:arylsulfatase